MKALKNEGLPVIKLENGYSWGNDIIGEIRYREPVLTKHLLDLTLSDMTVGDHVKIASRVCDLPPSFFEQLPIYELRKIVVANMGFFAPTPLTGESA
jgi:hypothetical protein